MTVIGLGPMGRAMATTLHGGRTSRDGVEPHAGPGRRARCRRRDPGTESGRGDRRRPSSPILSLTDYQAAYEILTPTVDDPQNAGVLAGKVIVNLSSDTPDVTREACRLGRSGTALASSPEA